MSELSVCLNVFFKTQEDQNNFSVAIAFRMRLKENRQFSGMPFLCHSCKKPCWLSEGAQHLNKPSAEAEKYFLLSSRKKKIQFSQVMNSHFTENYQIHNTRSFIEQCGKTLTHRPNSELLSHVTSLVSSNKSPGLVNLSASSEDDAAPTCPPAAVECPHSTCYVTTCPHLSSQPSLT